MRKVRNGGALAKCSEPLRRAAVYTVTKGAYEWTAEVIQ